MKFTPMTEDKINEMGLLPNGLYDFEVLNAKDQLSKNGNEMIKLTLKVFDKSGKDRIIYDYLLNLESTQYKIKHFCDVAGLGEKYKLGEFNSIDCLGKSGKAKIQIQKDKTGQYPVRNTVSDYVLSSEKKNIKIEKEDLGPEFDEHLPF